MVRALASIWYYAAVVVLSLGMVVVMAVVVLFAFPFDRERRCLNGISHLYARLIFWLNPLWRIKVVGLENIEPGRPYIITGNHQTMLDIPLMYSLPWRMGLKWVSKKEVYRWPLFGQILWLQKNIAVDTGSVSRAMGFIKRGRKCLEEGWSVVIFPEGTRSKTGQVGRFKEGAFRLAVESGVPILPVTIDDIRGFISGWRFTRRRITLSILPPIAGNNSMELMIKDKELIENELAILQNGRKTK